MLTIKRYNALEQLPAAYENLFEYAAKDSFFKSLPWFQNYTKTVLVQNSQIIIYGVEDEEQQARPVGALLLEKSRSGKLGLKQIKSLANYYSSLFGPLVDDRTHSSEEILALMVKALGDDRGSWDVLNFFPLEKSSNHFHQLLSELKKSKFLVQSYFGFGNLFLKINGRTADDFIKSLPSKLRKSIPYYDRRLKKEGDVKYTLVTEPQDVEKAISDYEIVYESSWREKEPFPGFIHGLASTAAQQKWLRLGLIYLNDRPISAQLWIVFPGTASIYKVCYDEEFSNISVGTLLTAFMMRHVIDVDKVEIVDYLTGEEDYKKKWMSDRRERWGIIAFNAHSFRGFVFGITQIWGRIIKNGVAGLWPRYV